MTTDIGVTPDPERIAAHAQGETGRPLPPIHLWNPPDMGDIDMRIARDGTWYYLGTPIRRPEMVRLFSTILRREDERFVLVTPVEKVGITVDDAPFVAVDMDAEGEGQAQHLIFTTNVGDRVVAGPDHPIRIAIDPESGEPSPYVRVRDELDALIDRKTFYRMIERGEWSELDGRRWFGLWSGGAFFPIAPEEAIEQ